MYMINVVFDVIAHALASCTLQYTCEPVLVFCLSSCNFRAKEALSRSCARIAAHFVGHRRCGAPLIVPFKGVSAFSSSVVFACVDPSETEVLQHLRSVTGEG